MPAPRFDLTPDQLRTFHKYSKDINDLQQTIAARLLSGDPSAGKATPQQMEYVQQLRQYMGVR
jgi:hypothetical protein